MKLLRAAGILIIFMTLLLAGCGSGGGNYNGDLTVTANKTDNGNNTSDVAFTVAYVNSQVTDYQGLDFSVLTTIDGTVVDSSTQHFSSSGSKIITYPGVAAGSTIRMQAQVGDIISAASATVPVSSISVQQTTLNFSSGAGKNATLQNGILGGTAPYFASSNTADITATVSGSIVTVTLNVGNSTSTASSATITVSDSNSKTTTFTVNYFK